LRIEPELARNIPKPGYYTSISDFVSAIEGQYEVWIRQYSKRPTPRFMQ
jgi:hypothetical protein